MKNLIKTSLLLFLSIFFTSCDGDSSSTSSGGDTDSACSESTTQETCVDPCTWTFDSATSASGGLAETNDFNITTGSTENGATRVIGFSLTGSSITDDQGTLISIESEGTPSSLDNIIIAGLTGTTEDLDGDGQSDENITVTFWDGTGSPPSGNYLYLESVDENTWNINFNIIPSIYGLQLDIIFSTGTCS